MFCIFLIIFETHVFGYQNKLFFTRDVKAHPRDLNAGTQLVYHFIILR